MGLRKSKQPLQINCIFYQRNYGMNKLSSLNTRSFRKTSCFLFLSLVIFIGCGKDGLGTDIINPGEGPYSLAGAQSIFINDGKLLITGSANDNGQFNTQYWVDSIPVYRPEFLKFVDDGTVYTESVDDKYRTVYSYKDLNGENQKFQFDQGSLFRDGEIFFYKNDSLITLDTVAIGTISSVSFLGNEPYYVGYFGKLVNTEAGETLWPDTPFIWDGGTFLQELPVPPQMTLFQGVSSVSLQDQNEFYVGGLGSFPMYWKNTEPIVLDSRYGEVWQVTKSGSDVYAVGLINKIGSNSTGHTACYWKNEELVELEDNAQAHSIFVDEDDVYVSGSVGRVPVQYTPCYWKNGVRIDLPF